MSLRILLVEDEPGLVMTLTDRLNAEGYVVDTSTDGEVGLSFVITKSFDLIILDLMLPQKSGFDVCREVRQAGIKTPIIMLTARGQVIDKVTGLKLGADDYLTKPFEMLELLARIEALLRRSSPSPQRLHDSYKFGNVKIDFNLGQIDRNGQPVELSAREFKLLRYLIERRGDTVSREELLNQVWGYHSMPSTRTVDVHIAWLRQKLKSNPRRPEFIHTMHGLGYKFLD